MGVAAAAEPRRLGPRAFALVRLLWWLLLPLAIAGPVLSGWREHLFVSQEVRGWASVGVELLPFEPPTLEPFGPAARAAGIRYEETVAAVQGQPVRSTEQARVAAAAAPPGPLTFTLVDESTGDRRTVTLPRGEAQLRAYDRQVGVSYSVMFWLTYLIELLPGLIWLTASVLLFRTRRREAAPMVLALGTLGAVTSSLWDSLADLYGPAWGLPGAVVLPAAFLAVAWALTSFPSGRLERRWQKAGLALVGLGLAAWGFGWVTDRVWTDQVAFGSVLAALLLAAAALALRWRATPPGPQRQQMKWAVGGLVGSLLFLAAGGYAILGVYDHLDLGQEAWTYLIAAGLGCVGLALIMAGLLVALLRYRLYDAEALLGRSAAVGVLTLAAVGVWAAAETILKDMLAGVIGADNGPALSALFATLAALVVSPARKRLSEWTRSRFQPGVAALTRDAPERLRDLRDIASPAEIARWAAVDVADAVRVTEAAVLDGEGAVLATAGSGGPPEDAVVRLALPAGLDGAPAGWLLLGGRPDGTPPGLEDRRAVEALAKPLGRALHAAEVRERRTAEEVRERTALREELDRLRVEVAALTPSRPPA